MARLLRLPPVLFFLLLVAASAAHAARPLTLPGLSWKAGMIAGGALLLLAVGIAWAALAELKKHKTTEEPGARPAALVTTGPFRFSRNPLYVSLTLILAGIALMTDSAWLAAAAALLVVMLDRLVIRTEESVLAEVFGDDYRAYTRRVRRWL